MYIYVVSDPSAMTPTAKFILIVAFSSGAVYLAQFSIFAYHTSQIRARHDFQMAVAVGSKTYLYDNATINMRSAVTAV